MTIWDDSASMSGTAECTACNSTVTCRRMPGSDRCRTKGAVVYRYVPSLLHFLRPPILFLSTGDRPPPASATQADLNVVAEKKDGRWVCRD